MNIVKPEFETASLNELSRLKCASTSEQRVNNGSVLVHRRIEKEREPYQCNLEAVSSGKKPWQDSRTLGAEKAVKNSVRLGYSRGKALGVSCKGKAVVCTSEIEKLKERLRVLEEEIGTMKQELFESAEERKQLMNEVYQQFQMLEIDPRYLATRDFKSSDGLSSSVNSTLVTQILVLLLAIS